MGFTCLAGGSGLLVGTKGWSVPADKGARPNILWLTCEDTGTELGCYGDDYAVTPNIDRFATKGLRYKYAWSTAPVCAPARSTLISGMYPPSLGSHHMRSLTHMPKDMRMYPCYLRDAGYYCTNNSKRDYNLAETGEVWDESSKSAHWKNRAPGQPFFAIFNSTASHEGKVTNPQVELIHDPGKVPVPAYHPDTPEVRRDWAQYYSNVTAMDKIIGQQLQELEDAGLAEDTIVFFYGDHGAGIPRHKRFAFNSGLHVGFIVYIPEKFKHLAPKDYAAGAASERLAGFVDFGPTAISLAGLKPPAHMQGKALMGKYEAPKQKYLFGFRGRTDERYDNVRTVRDQRYIYIRHFMPYRPYGQHVEVMFKSGTAQSWKRLFDEGKLTPEQAAFWKTKPSEELYDLQKDPDEVNNLVDSPAHQKVLRPMRSALHDWQLDIRDVGLLPEGEIHARSEGSSPYEMGHNAGQYPIKKVLAAADLATSGKAKGVPELKQALEDADSAVRYWGAVGLLCRGKAAIKESKAELRTAMKDDSPYVRLVAAEAVARYGDAGGLEPALAVLLDIADTETNGYAALEAVNALEYVCTDLVARDANVKDLAQRIRSINPEREYIPDSKINSKLVAWPKRIINHILEILESAN